jgi:hypothetical protein
LTGALNEDIEPTVFKVIQYLEPVSTFRKASRFSPLGMQVSLVDGRRALRARFDLA